MKKLYLLRHGLRVAAVRVVGDQDLRRFRGDGGLGLDGLSQRGEARGRRAYDRDH